MRIEPVFQPYSNQDTIFHRLQNMLHNPEITSITLVSAWGKSSALRRLAPHIAHFRIRGGEIRAILGLSQGGATEEGLRASLDLLDCTWVVYHPRGRTFHPKLYIGTGTNSFSLIVGSGNLTAAGISTNFEAALQLDGDKKASTDFAILSEYIDYIDRLIADKDICKELSEELLEALIADQSIVIGRESRSENAQDEKPVQDTDLFGESVFALSSAPSLSQGYQTPVPNSAQQDANSGANLVERYVPNPQASAYWSKKLPTSDSMRIHPGHPTGHLALTRAAYAISPDTWFRKNLFASCEWVQVFDRGQLREQAVVDFLVRGIWQEPRTVSLQIDHTPSWESGQGNRATTVRWGPLMTLLRSRIDVTGKYVVIERLRNGHFEMTFTSQFATI